MAKSKYRCTSCGTVYAKWRGRCSECGQWDSIEETTAVTAPSQPQDMGIGDGKGPQRLNLLLAEPLPRLSTGSGEMDRLLGGGLVPGSLTLCVGDPGIGKSTLALQMAGQVAAGGTVLYVSGEESEAQMRMRADRLGMFPDALYVVAETRLERIGEYVGTLNPVLVIIDSIQRMAAPGVETSPGSVTQIREATDFLLGLAKGTSTALFIIGQVTKDSAVAGPRVLEHMVDTVLSFEGSRHRSLRMVRAVKNRFGATDDAALFEMGVAGLQDVGDPSRHLLVRRREGVVGAAVVASGLGHRPLFYELAALTTVADEGAPKRTVVGISRGRLDLVAAVMDRYTTCQLGSHTLYVSLAGGFETDDPALDLGMAAALASSRNRVPVPLNTVWIGEVALTGEVRAVPDLARLLAEAERLGFRQAVVPDDGVEGIEGGEGLTGLAAGRRMEVVPVRTVRDVVEGLSLFP